MNDLPAMLVAAGWLGVLTSISPCPLATNIAAVSYLSRRMHSRRMAVAGALAYAAGRATLYVVVGLLIAWGMASAPALSALLQHQVGPFVGPLLILVALVLLGWLSLPIRVGLGWQSLVERLASFGLLGEFLIGGLFALTFCPVSAALFFGVLLPMVLCSSVSVLSFAVYGVGTALPVAILSILFALGFAASKNLLAVIQQGQGRIQTFTALILLLVGLWLTLTLSFGLFTNSTTSTTSSL